MPNSKPPFARAPVDGVWHAWTAWSQCTHTCNGGKQSRQRVCTYEAGAKHGAPCSGSSTDIQDCGMDECPGKLV